MVGLGRVLRGKDLFIGCKVRMLEGMVIIMVLCDSETWRLNGIERRRVRCSVTNV